MSSKLSSLDVFTLEEAADYLRLSTSVLLQKANDGSIPGQPIDSDSWQFLKSAIDDWLGRPDDRSILLRQAGIFAHDETLQAMQDGIDRDRQQNRFGSETTSGDA
jgi:hypothetical protein